MTTLAGTLGEYFAGFSMTNIPGPQVDTLKRLLLDFWGVAAAGSRTPSGNLAIEYAVRTGGVPEATIIGRNLLTCSQQAAFSNAISAHSLELDDVDSRALFHFGPPIIAAALSACEAQGGSGLDLLLGVGAGCEMMSRLSQASNPALRDRGFHTTAVCGAFGATVAVGHILHLTAEKMTSALGLAGAQASGLMEMYGPSMQKRFNAGPAARVYWSRHHLRRRTRFCAGVLRRRV
jgi:2-methylcitrate dehydratase PrpD